MGMKFGRFLLWFFKPLYWLLFPYKVVGREHVPKESDGPVILCCNHQSYLDPVYLLMSQKRHIYFMAKAELMKGRLGHWFFANVMGVFPVKRGTGDTGAIDTAVQLVKEGKMMGIFPEGTRSRDGKLGRGKSRRRSDRFPDGGHGAAGRDPYQKSKAADFPQGDGHLWGAHSLRGAASGRSGAPGSALCLPADHGRIAGLIGEQEEAANNPPRKE